MKVTTATSLGNTSLAAAIAGLIATELALRHGWVAAPAWKVLLQAFEAATVGGLADWFAVSALFREVPVPLIRRHTNIIIKNRQRIVDGIADMVENRWLAPNIIREYLVNFSASQYVLNLLSNEDHLEKVLAVVRDIIQHFVRGITAPEATAFLERILKDQLRDLRLAEPLGRWMGQRIRSGDHHDAWNMLLLVMKKAVQQPEMKAIVQRAVVHAFEGYKDGGRLKRLIVALARRLNIVNEEELVASFLSRMEEMIREAQSDPAHPLRVHIDGIVIEFADKLAVGDADAVSAIEKLQAALINGTDVYELLQRMLRRLSDTIEKEFQKSDSDFNNLMRRTFHDRLDIFRADAAAQEKVDCWVTEFALELMEKRHEMIGQMVRGSLEKLSDLDLVGQIEEKVGQDLQYIRLNGAIVGGLAGAVLAIMKLLA